MTPSEPDPSDSSRAPSQELAQAVRSSDFARAAGVLEALEVLYGLPTSPDASKPDDEARAGKRQAGGLTEGGGFVPFYFTDPKQAEAYAREQGFVSEGEVVTPPRHTDAMALVRAAHDEGYDGIVIDPATGHPAVLTPATMEAILGASAAASSATPSDSPTGSPPDRIEAPSPHLLDLEQRVRRSPSLDPVPPPDISPAEARDLLQELRELQMADRIPVWEVVDALAFQMRFFVPVAPDPAQGLRWPLIVRHPREPDVPSVWIFTDPDEARRALEPLPGHTETLELSGLEAFRWIWAVPTPVQEVVIDLYPDSPPPFFVPDTWMLGALYPHFLNCPALRRVRRVPLTEIGGLPGARGTKPECIRALVEGWRDLQRSSGDPTETVRHAGGRYLPAVVSPGGAGRAPDTGESGPASASDPPFRRWLTESADVSGVVLDPDGPHPLGLDHTDLAVLALWSETGDRPDGTALAGLVEELRSELGASVAGRILADWPRYFWALQASSGGGGAKRGGSDPVDGDAGDAEGVSAETGDAEGVTRAMTLPERDACPVFTSEDRIRRFLRECRERELVSPDMRALVYLSGWAFNVFREMHVRYREGGWLNPETAPPEEGLEIDTEMVRSALARIEWRLQPRIPGFLANP